MSRLLSVGFVFLIVAVRSAECVNMTAHMETFKDVVESGANLFNLTREAFADGDIEIAEILEIADEFGRFLTKFSPLASAVESFLQRRGDPTIKQEVAANLMKMQSRFNDLERDMKLLSGHVSKVVFNQDYENNVVLALHDVNRANELYVAQANAENLRNLRAKCASTDGQLRLWTALDTLDYYINRDRLPPFLLDTLFDSSAYDLKSLTANVGMLFAEIAQFGYLIGICIGHAETSNRPSPDQRQLINAQVLALQHNLTEQLDVLRRRLRNDWHLRQLTDDLQQLMGEHRYDENDELANKTWQRLTTKYYWVDFRVVVFDHKPGDKYQLGDGDRFNSGQRGLSWTSRDDKTVLVSWAVKNGTKLRPETLADLDEALSRYESVGTFGFGKNCYPDAGATLTSLKHDETLSKIEVQGRFVVLLPQGGSAAAFGSVESDRNLRIIGDDGNSRMTFLCRSSKVGFSETPDRTPVDEQLIRKGSKTGSTPLVFVLFSF